MKHDDATHDGEGLPKMKIRSVEEDDFVGMETEVVPEALVTKTIRTVASTRRIVFCKDTVRISFKSVKIPFKPGNEENVSNWPILEEREEVEFQVDEGQFHIPGIDCALLHMREGEQSDVVCEPDWSYGTHGELVPEVVAEAIAKSQCDISRAATDDRPGCSSVPGSNVPDVKVKIKVTVTLLAHTPWQKVPTDVHLGDEKAKLSQIYRLGNV
jgi:FKBP-type peptidyl-prolyl cis-trans isomerase 2